MPVASFDGPNKTITLLYAGGQTAIEAIQIYSEWKTWFLSGNAQYLPAFSPNPFGGNPIGVDRNVGSYYFVNNVDGWTLKPEDNYTFEININGDLYPANTNLTTYPWITPNTGGDAIITFDRSAATQVVVSQGSVSDIQDAVWNAPLTSHKNSGSTGQRLGALYPKSYGI